MKRPSSIPLSLSPFLLCIAAAWGQSGPAPTANAANLQSTQPVSYASVTQLNGLLAQLEESPKNPQADLAKLGIEGWKTRGAPKKEPLGKVDSVQRNLQGS